MEPAPPSSGFARPASGWFTAARILAFLTAALLFAITVPVFGGLVLFGGLFAEADTTSHPLGSLAPASIWFTLGLGCAVAALVLTAQRRRRVGAALFAGASLAIGAAFGALDLAVHQSQAVLPIAAVAFGIMAVVSVLCWTGIAVGQGSNGARLTLGALAVCALVVVLVRLPFIRGTTAQGGLLGTLPALVGAAVMTYGFLVDPRVRAAFRRRL
ncbi:MAG: hypothetical protein ACYDEA_06385 [Candidatus Dormibacteria bacterium]